jgi:HK97 family phage prohead protease
MDDLDRLEWTFELTKAEGRYVEGYATAEVVDKQGDLVPFEEAVRAFDEFVRTSGAVREMHQPRAVGRVVAWKALPDEKKIWVRVYVSATPDGQSVLQKIKEGILRGFSIAGQVLSSTFKHVGDEAVRVLEKIRIHELSIVDNPANPLARITLVKANYDVDSDPVEEEPPLIKELIFGSPDEFDDLDEEMAKRMTDEEKARLEEVLRARGRKVGISRKEGEPLTPPKGYPKDPRLYADPANWSWPVDNPGRARAAIAYYNAGKGRDVYTDAEWKRLGRRIARMAGKILDRRYRLEGDRIVSDEEKVLKALSDAISAMSKRLEELLSRKEVKEMDALRKDDISAVVSALQRTLEEAAQGVGTMNLQEAARMAAQTLAQISDKISELERQFEEAQRSQPDVSPAPDLTSPPGVEKAAPKATDSPTAGGKDTPAGRGEDTDSPAGDDDTMAKARRRKARAKPVVPATDEEDLDEDLGDDLDEEDEVEKRGRKKTAAKAKEAPASPMVPKPKETGELPTELASTPATVSKAEEPAASHTPSPTVIFSRADEIFQKYVDFAMRGEYEKAWQAVGGDQSEGLRIALSAAKQLLGQAGLTAENASEFWATFGQREIVADPFITPEQEARLFGKGSFAKALSATQAPGIYLVRMVRLLLPLYAALRRRIPVEVPEIGSNTAIWRVSFKPSGWTSAVLSAWSQTETGTGGASDTDFVTFEAPYARITVGDEINLETTAAMRGYDDPFQISILRSFTLMLEAEERKLIGDNYAAIDNPSSVSATVGSGGSIPARTAAKVAVSALTYYGYLNGTKGTATHPGESAATQSSSFATGSGSTVTVSWPAVPGAAAYNVYYSPDGTNWYYAATVTTTKYTLTAEPATTASLPADNQTARTSTAGVAFEGLISWASLSTIYGQTIPNKVSLVDAGGNGLTSYPGGIVEFDNVLEEIWSKWQVSPTLALMSPKTNRHVTKVLLDVAKPQYYIVINNERGNVAGGAMVTAYVNKYAAFFEGSQPLVRFIAHPYMPDGMVLFLSEFVPYPTARESRGFVLTLQQPYLFFPRARVVLSYPYSIYTRHVLTCHYPGAQAAIVGINSAA